MVLVHRRFALVGALLVWLGILPGPVPMPATAAEPASAGPRARLELAPLLEFPADPDCNSPCFWHAGRLHRT